MNDAYVNGWSIAWWVVAGAVVLFGVLGIWSAFAIEKETPKGRREIIGGSIAMLVIAALLVGVGFMARGSRSADNLRAAITAENKAKQDLQDLNYEQCGRPVCPGGAFGY